MHRPQSWHIVRRPSARQSWEMRMAFHFLQNVVKIHYRVGLFSNGVVDENFLDLYGIQLLGRKKLSIQPTGRSEIYFDK